jgi:hypothetical protein
MNGINFLKKDRIIILMAFSLLLISILYLPFITDLGLIATKISSSQNSITHFSKQYHELPIIPIRTDEDHSPLIPSFSTKETIFESNITEVITSDITGEKNPNNPCLIKDLENNIHVFWEEKNGINNRPAIYTRVKSDSQWGSITPLIVNDTFSDTNIALALDTNGTIHMAWSRSKLDFYAQIMYSNSLNWSNIQRIRKPFIGDDAINPTIVVDTYGIIHIAWEERSYGDSFIKYASSKDWDNVISIPSQSMKAQTPIIRRSPIDNTTRIAYMKDPASPHPAVTWIDGESNIETYEDSNISTADFGAPIGYEICEGTDYISWMDQDSNCYVSYNDADYPDDWYEFTEVPTLYSGTHITEIRLAILEKNMPFVLYRCTYDQRKVFGVAIFKNSIWKHKAPIGSLEHNWLHPDIYLNNKKNIEMVFYQDSLQEDNESIIYYQIALDNSAPEVTITNPKDDSFVKGVVNVTVLAEDSAGIKQVEFEEKFGSYFVPRYTDYKAPYIWTWDTTNHTSSYRYLRVTAIDNNGEFTEKEISLLVDNQKPSISTVLKIPGYVEDNSTVTISCQISDNFEPVKNATVYYKHEGAKSWNSSKMIREGATYHFIDINMTKGNTTILYYIEAFDQAGNKQTTTEFSFEVEWIDLDNDGLGDNIESKYGCDPNNPDTDGDGLEDGDEVYIYQTDPTKKDTDGDGYSDKEEVEKGSDPNDSNSVPPGWFTLHRKPLIIFSSIIGGVLLIALVLYLLMSKGIIEFKRKEKREPTKLVLKWRAFWAQVGRGIKRTFKPESTEVTPMKKKKGELQWSVLSDEQQVQIEKEFDGYLETIEVITFDFLIRKLNLIEDSLEEFLIEMKKKGKPIIIDLEDRKITVSDKTESK